MVNHVLIVAERRDIWYYWDLSVAGENIVQREYLRILSQFPY